MHNKVGLEKGGHRGRGRVAAVMVLADVEEMLQRLGVDTPGVPAPALCCC